jgi:hypothetical protein
MKPFTLRVLVILITFSLGLAAVSFWLHKRQRYFQYERINGHSPENPLAKIVLDSLSTRPEEYAVYSAILNDHQDKNVFVYDFTTVGLTKDAESLDNVTLGLDVGTIEDFALQNKEKLKLENKFRFKGKVNFISLEGKLRPRSFPRWRFSRIGFNQNKTQALVRVSYTPCEMCGNISLVLLRKVKGNWFVQQQIILGVS